MQPYVRERQRRLPVGIHESSRRIVTLAEVEKNLGDLSSHEALSRDEQAALVAARWQAGEWQDLTHGTEGEIDMQRALREIKSGSELGQQLLTAGLRAISMLREDLATEGTAS